MEKWENIMATNMIMLPPTNASVNKTENMNHHGEKGNPLIFTYGSGLCIK